MLGVCALVASLAGGCSDPPLTDGGTGGHGPLPPPRSSFAAGSGVAAGSRSTPPRSEPPAVGGADPDAPLASCESAVAMRSQGFASSECAACLCARAAQASTECTVDCWSVIQCVIHFGCGRGDVGCAVEHCGNGLCGFAHCDGENAIERFSSGGTLAQQVPVRECSSECLPLPDGGVTADACAPLRAEPATAMVGESIALAWDERVGAGEFALSVTPWATVGSLRALDAGHAFRCDAPGRAIIELVSDRCDTPLQVEVECLARPDAQCCAIEPLAEAGASGCSALGGSPPCLRGCGCLREGGVYYTEIDAQGCLQWVLRPALDSPDHLVCLDEAGQPAPDPRHPP